MNNVSVENHHHPIKNAFFSRIIHFFKWWLALTGLIAATSVCPFCGMPGCPVGVGAATSIGGILSIFMQNWKEPFRWTVKYFRKGKEKEKGKL